MSEKIKAYKGFNRDMTCRGFQYKEGESYTHDGDVEPCQGGFHACERPLDVFCYYPPATSIFHEVELGGKIKEHGDKHCASEIRIGARLDIAGLCKATFDYVRKRCTNENNAEAGEPATAGSYGAATAGSYGAATAGDNGVATAGDNGAATSRGASSVGVNGLCAARGNDVKVRGGMGAMLIIVEENGFNFGIAAWKAAVVDGDKILPDIWYKLVDGEFVKAED